MDLKTLIPLIIQVSIWVTVFGFGLQSTWADALYLFRRPKLLLRSVLAMYVIMPCVAIILTRLIDLPPAIKIALLTLSVSPIPPLLSKKNLKAGGAEPYVVGMLVAPAILSIAFMPLALAIFERIFEVPLVTKGGAILEKFSRPRSSRRSRPVCSCAACSARGRRASPSRSRSWRSSRSWRASCRCSS